LVPEKRAEPKSFSILIPGIGGTGVVTLAGIVARAARSEGYCASVFDMTGLAQKGGAVLSHVKISRDQNDLIAPKIGPMEADLILGCDLMVAAGSESLSAIDNGRTVAVINRHITPTGAFQLDPNIALDGDKFIESIRVAISDEKTVLSDTTEIARQILGDTIGANMIVLGMALQKGYLPISVESVFRAIEEIGVAPDRNRLAVNLGRLVVHDPEVVEASLALDHFAEVDLTTDELTRVIGRRVEYLTEYQNVRYASRFRELVRRVAATEDRLWPGGQELTLAVARNYFKLLAYKDEYEVARLYSLPQFRKMVRQEFGENTRLSLHLAPPMVSGSGKNGGRPSKRQYGPWIFSVLRVVSALRFLRGTPFDVFGYMRERRQERALIREYEVLVEEILDRLCDGSRLLALELLNIPDQIKGFGHVKRQSMNVARDHQALLTEKLRSSPLRNAHP
jgi:indolepyruvate ferredoxin oxidoreductase